MEQFIQPGTPNAQARKAEGTIAEEIFKILERADRGWIDIGGGVRAYVRIGAIGATPYFQINNVEGLSSGGEFFLKNFVALASRIAKLPVSFQNVSSVEGELTAILRQWGWIAQPTPSDPKLAVSPAFDFYEPVA